MSPDIPASFIVFSRVLFWIAVVVFVIGSCIYAKGIGYPFWLGIFGVTLIGLVVLMLLPDRYPDDDLWPLYFIRNA
jgi:hypothetical protein